MKTLKEMIGDIKRPENKFLKDWYTTIKELEDIKHLTISKHFNGFYDPIKMECYGYGVVIITDAINTNSSQPLRISFRETKQHYSVNSKHFKSIIEFRKELIKSLQQNNLIK